MVVFHHIPGKLPTTEGFMSMWGRVNLSIGVELFMVISGFLIMRSLLASDPGVACGRMSLSTFKEFWVRRAFRLLPASILWLALSFASLLLLSPSSQEIFLAVRASLLAGLGIYNVSNAYCVAIGGFGTTCPSFAFTHIYWSLSLEEQFYLLLAIAMLFLRPRTFLIAAAIILSAVIGARWAMGVGNVPTNTVYNIANRSYGLFFGCLLAISHPRLEIFVRKIGAKSRLLLIVSLLLVSIKAGVSGEAVATLGVSFIYFLVVLLALPGGAFALPLLGNAFNWIGERSYAIYLSQMSVLYLIGALAKLLASEFPVHATLVFLSSIGASVLVIALLSDLTHRFAEVPMIEYGRRFAGRASGAKISTA